MTKLRLRVFVGNPVIRARRYERTGAFPGLMDQVRLEVAQPRPDLVRERVREPVEDGDGLAPGRVGGTGVALGQQGVAEPGQRVALAERGGDLAVGLDGLGVVGLGLGDVAQVQVDVAEAVQGVGGAAAVAGIAVQAQRPLAVGQRPVVLAQVRRTASRPRSPGWPGSTSARRP